MHHRVLSCRLRSCHSYVFCPSQNDQPLKPGLFEWCENLKINSQETKKDTIWVLLVSLFLLMQNPCGAGTTKLWNMENPCQLPIHGQYCTSKEYNEQGAKGADFQVQNHMERGFFRLHLISLQIHVNLRNLSQII